jgi:hypothetical protein
LSSLLLNKIYDDGLEKRPIVSYQPHRLSCHRLDQYVTLRLGLFLLCYQTLLKIGLCN